MLSPRSLFQRFVSYHQSVESPTNERDSFKSWTLIIIIINQSIACSSPLSDSKQLMFSRLRQRVSSPITLVIRLVQLCTKQRSPFGGWLSRISHQNQRFYLAIPFVLSYGRLHCWHSMLMFFFFFFFIAADHCCCGHKWSRSLQFSVSYSLVWG